MIVRTKNIYDVSLKFCFVFFSLFAITNLFSQTELKVKSHSTETVALDVLYHNIYVQKFEPIRIEDLPKDLDYLLEWGNESERDDLMVFLDYYNQTLSRKLNEALKISITELKNPERFHADHFSDLMEHKDTNVRFVLKCDIDLELLMRNLNSSMFYKNFVSEKDFLNNDFKVAFWGEYYLYDKRDRVVFAEKNTLESLLFYLDEYYQILGSRDPESITDGMVERAHQRLRSLEQSYSRVENKFSKKSKRKNKKEENSFFSNVIGLLSSWAVIALVGIRVLKEDS